MKLYWHKWVTRRGTSYHLSMQPFSGDTSTRRLDGEVASVMRLSNGWRYDISQVGNMAGMWGVTGSPVRSRRIVEERISQKPIAAFDEDRLEFVAA